MKDVLKVLVSRAVIVPILIVVVAMFTYFILSKIIRKMLSFKTRGIRIDARKQKTTIGLIDNILKYFIAIVALLMLLDCFGVDTKSLIASLGVLTAVIGLAFQDFIKDIIAGISIIFEDQYAIGDVVTIGSFKGTVTYLGIKSTRVMAYTGEILIISNHKVDRVINHTLANNISIIDVGVDYGSDIAKVKEVMNSVCEDINKSLKLTENATVCGVEKLDDSSIVMRMIFGSNYANKYEYERIIREKIKLAFDENNIKIPFPHVEVCNGE